MAKQKIVTRRRTWITKSGQVKEKTYTYLVETGGKKTVKGRQQKQQFKTIVRAEKQQGKRLTKDEAIDAIKKSNLPEIQFKVLNELKFNKKYKNGITEKGLERLISQEKLSSSEQFIRNLGYTEEEFEREFNLTSKQIANGTLTSTNGLTKFTSATGQTLYFSWDYERGAQLV